MGYTPGIYHQDESIAAVLSDVARAHRILELEGHGDMSMGHLSYRDPFGRGMWLKRGNLALSEVAADDFILVDLDGNVLEGTGLRHLEWPLHAEIFKARPDVNVVGHSHAHYATVLGAADSPLQPYNNHGVWFAEHGVPRFSDTSHIITTVPLGVEVAKQLGDSEAILLANHGVAFVGHDVIEATLAGIFLEKAAKFQLDLAASTLSAVIPDPEESLEKFRRIYPRKAQLNFWMYFNRKLEDAEASTSGKVTHS
ncbi:class II aldolase/adducin family protein [Pseudoclavibacter sp. RFBB5]|uniref:class II aldolase/adducin family protein n=1 Tax=Pseudoclavibacter sp. RFBB5 TaxID=2080574 RepID=UPI000CE875C4|nr:class II aldolase/adducin family protein [Pseudoclavibacter sp. RFBB5]PPG31220.1 class II aldolase family protein [Pseudoclavibacter sp. RFBB5]